MKRFFEILIFLLLTITGSASTAFAGSLAPDLSEIINRSGPDEMIEVYLLMSDKVDLTALKATLITNRATLARRHATVIEALRLKAETSQQDLLSFLEIEKQLSNVRSYQSLWIGNYVLLTAKPSLIGQVAARQDVETVFFDNPIEMIKPVKSYQTETRDGDDPQISDAEPGLTDINAHLLWAEGITGEGRIVANFDTGVSGTHPALAPKWRGNNGAPAEASWLDLDGNSPFPVDYDGHGTHTMGTMLGSNDATGDTVGVAFGAQWIAAGPLRGGTIVSDAIQVFQWMADPDGDPETMDDVPDAVNNSWYDPYASNCFSGYNDAIDGAEAAGVAVVFSAGNGGPGSYSITEPKNRIASEVNIFTVGALEPGSTSVAGFSSRGPSVCILEPGQPDSLLVKPEASARGVSVRSSVPGGGYEGAGWSGTSMAAPHVTGSIALLRQINPEATPEELKLALVHSAFDLDVPGNDNNTGFGRIDVHAASRLLGGNVEGHVTLIGADNHGDVKIWTTLDEQKFAISDSSGYYQIKTLSEDYHTFVARRFGYYDGTVEDVFIPLGETTQNIDFSLNQVESQPQNLTAGSELNQAVPLDWQSPELVPAYYNVYRGLQSGGPYERIAEMVTETHYVDEMLDNGRTYFYVLTAVYENPYGESSYSNEAAAIPGQRQDLPLESDFEEDDAGLYVLVIDQGESGSLWEYGQPDSTHGPASAASGSMIWATGLEQNYANNADAYLLTPLLDLTEATEPKLSFDHWYEFEGSNERGDDGGNIAVSTNAGDDWIVVDPWSPYDDQGVPGLDQEPGFTGTSYGEWIHSQFILSEFIGQVIIIRFRFGSDIGISRAGWFIDNLRIVNEAIAVEAEIVTETKPFRLDQNHPNPFNPSTSISFQIPLKETVCLEVYNVSGRLVKTLKNGEMQPGFHTLTWNGSNDQGLAVSSGVYFYTLKTDSFISTKRMVMLK